MQVASISKVLLSTIMPYFGEIIVSAAVAGTDVFSSMTQEELVQKSIEVGNSAIDSAFNVDLSNAQVANVMFSEKSMGRIKNEVRSLITEAI